MQVKSIVECSKESILQYFWPSLSYHLSLGSLLCLFLSGLFTQVLLYFKTVEPRAEGYNTVPPVRLELATPQFQIKHPSTEPLCYSQVPKPSSNLINKQTISDQSLSSGFTQAWKVLEYTGLSWKVLENKIMQWKLLEKHSKASKSPWILPFARGFNTFFLGLNQYKIVVPFLVQHMLHRMKAP